MKKNKLIIIIIIVVLIIAGGIYWIKFRDKPVEVKEVEVESVVVQKTVSSSGSIKSQSDANLSFSASGRLARLNVEKDEETKKGTILARLDSYSQSQSAQALKDARDIALREKDLFVQNYADEKDEVGGDEQYDIKIRQLNERISQAQASYQSQLGSISNLYVKAPFDGTILDTYKEEGEVVIAGESVIKVADLSQLYFEVELDQEDFGFVQVGQKVEVELDAYEDFIFQGTVTDLPKYANTDLSTGESFIVEIQVMSDSEHPILLGMSGDASIIIEGSDSEVQAVTFDKVYSDSDNNNYVWIFSQNTITKQPIEIGLEGDIYTEILTDLSEKIVVVLVDDTEVEDDTSKAKLAK